MRVVRQLLQAWLPAENAVSTEHQDEKCAIALLPMLWHLFLLTLVCGPTSSDHQNASILVEAEKIWVC